MVTNTGIWKVVEANTTPAFKKIFRDEKNYLDSHVRKNSKVLEVGCGDGRILNDIIHLTKNLTGIDHDIKAVEAAKTNFKNVPEVKIILVEAKEMPFKDNEFDTLTCMLNLANFGANKVKILKEMRRVLKPNGKIVMSVYSEDAFQERMKLYKKVKIGIKEIHGTTVLLDFEGNLEDHTSEQFSKNQLMELFNKTNLKVLDIKKSGIIYLFTLGK